MANVGRLAVALLFGLVLAREAAVSAPIGNALHLEHAEGAPVAAAGITHFAAGAASVALLARRATPQENTSGHITACSGGWVKCSLVDRLVIKVHGREIYVPRRAVLMVSNVDRGKLVILPHGRYELDLAGGDAAASYQAYIFFDGTMVRRVEIWAGESHMLEQRTDFQDLSHAFL